MKFDNNVFIHIPKNLGTTIETVILKKYYNFNLQEDELPLNKNAHVWYEYWNSKYKIEDSNFREDFKSKHTQPLSVYINSFDDIENIFTIVRNPYDRIISLYKDTKKRNEHYGDKFIYNESFDHFIKTGYFKNNKLLDHYSKRQVDFIDCDKEIKILKMEEPEKIIEYLNSISIKINELPKTNVSKHEEIDINPYIDIINEYYYEDFVKFDYKML